MRARPAGGGDAPHTRQQQRPVARPNGLRKLRIAEFFMGSGRLTMAFKDYGVDALCIERDVKAPEYDGKYLVKPQGPPFPQPGDAVKAMRAAKTSAEGKAFLELCSARDLRVVDLPTLDYIHFSPQCTSVTRAAGDKHLRTGRGWARN